MIETIEKFLKKYNLLTEETKLLVAFSGGFDSCALLDSLYRLQKKHKFTLCAAHLNHGWRKESDNEENFCKNFCEARNILFISEKLLPNTPKTETAARHARYNFFEKAAHHFNTKLVLSAHTKSDNTETVIYRIAKGTGVNGLCAIKEKTVYNSIELFRPLLSLSRSDIEFYCNQNKLTPNNDLSNYDTKYKRNLIRHEILPILRKINPNIQSAINNLSENAVEEEEIVEEYLQIIKEKICDGNKIKTDKFITLSKPVKQKLIHNLCKKEALEYDREKILNILDFIETAYNFKTGRTYSLTSGVWLFCSSKEFYIINQEENKLPPALVIKEFNGIYKYDKYLFTIEQFKQKDFCYPKETDNYALVDLSHQQELILRYRKQGDIIQPFGMQNTTKLKKYMINKNIPKHKKDTTVLLCNGEEVLWVYQYGISEKLRVKEYPTHIIRIEEVTNGSR